MVFRFALIFATTLVAAACTSCSSPEGQDSDSGIDADASTVSTSSETETSSQTETDTATETETVDDTSTETSEEWNWETLPTGEDCGSGCRQVSFSERVESEQWDVSDGLLVYNGTGAADKMGPQEHLLHVVDLSKMEYLSIPNAKPDVQESSYATAVPTVFQRSVYYGWYEWGKGLDVGKVDIVAVDLDSLKQRIIYKLTEENPNGVGVNWHGMDAGAIGLAAQGGCGDPTIASLCLFPVAEPLTPRVLVAGSYGSHNTVFGDKVLYYTGEFDIHLYDLGTDEVLKITDDSYTPAQLMARMHRDKVVYQDLRFGEGGAMGNWNHSAVFAYDLESKETKQITNGDWIACYPDVHGDVIVWLDYRACSNPNDINQFRCAQVWGRNMKTGKESQITNMDRPKDLVRIWGDKVFVSMVREDSNYDSIFMFDLPEELK